MKHAARVLSLSTIFVLLSVFSAGAAEAPAPARFDNPTTTVFINEIHYDNTGTDAGEAIEIAGPAGTDLTGWSIVLYNGSNGAVYDTDPLSGVIADQADGYGTVSISYPSNGIQNGAPDGIALVDASSAVTGSRTARRTESLSSTPRAPSSSSCRTRALSRPSAAPPTG